MSFAEALAAGESAPLSSSRDALLAKAGAEVLVDASGVAANFQRMVRIADATGIPVDDMTSELGSTIREELGLYGFEGAANSTPKP